MKEKIIGGIIAVAMVLSCIGIIVFAAPITAGEEVPDPVATISEDYIPSETAPAEDQGRHQRRHPRSGPDGILRAEEPDHRRSGR